MQAHRRHRNLDAHAQHVDGQEGATIRQDARLEQPDLGRRITTEADNPRRARCAADSPLSTVPSKRSSPASARS